MRPSGSRTVSNLLRRRLRPKIQAELTTVTTTTATTTTTTTTTTTVGKYFLFYKSLNGEASPCSSIVSVLVSHPSGQGLITGWRLADRVTSWRKSFDSQKIRPNIILSKVECSGWVDLNSKTKFAICQRTWEIGWIRHFFKKSGDKILVVSNSIVVFSTRFELLLASLEQK